MRVQKKERPSGTERNRRDAKNNMTVYAGIIAYIISLVIRVPLSRAIGDAGMGLFAPAYELFFLTALIFSYGISRTMTGLIRYRMKRSQYKSARKVFHLALRVSLVLGIVLALVIVAASDFFSETLVLEAMSKKALLVVAPAVVLTALVNVLRGYFNGNGFGVLVAHSQYIEKVTMAVAAFVGGRLCYDYGLKVEALQHNNIVSYAYGALGAMIGVMLSQLITLIYILFVFVIYSGTWKRQLAQDNGRRMEGDAEIIGALIGNGVPVALIAIFSNIFMLIDQRFFNYCMNRRELADTRTALWGSYYSKFAVLTGIGAAIVCLSVHGTISKAISAYEKDDYHMSERIGYSVKKLCVTAFPVAVFLAVLAEAFIKGIYQGESEQAVSLVRQGTVIIFFYGIAYLFGQYMLKLHMLKELFLSLFVAVAVHFLALFLLVRKSLLGADGVLYAVILFIAVFGILCFVFTGRKVKYRQEWLYSVAFPAVSAAVSGLIVMLLGKLLPGVLGNIPTILISCLIGTIIYFILLTVLRVLNEAELSQMPLGGIWIAIGRMIGVL